MKYIWYVLDLLSFGSYMTRGAPEGVEKLAHGVIHAGSTAVAANSPGRAVQGALQQLSHASSDAPALSHAMAGAGFLLQGVNSLQESGVRLAEQPSVKNIVGATLTVTQSLPSDIQLAGSYFDRAMKK